MKAEDGSELGQEEYVSHIHSWHNRGVLQLVLVVRMMAGIEVPQMYYQIWQNAGALPTVLWHAQEVSEDAASSSTRPAVSLKLVMLSQSKILVWLPLIRADKPHSNSADAVGCQQQLNAVDKNLVASAAAKAEKTPAEQPQPKPFKRESALQTKLQSY